MVIPPNEPTAAEPAARPVDDPAWIVLDRELDAWREASLVATFWWRDDDATRATPAFERLVAISRRYQAPLALAAIPAHSEANLAGALTDASTVTVWQHGHSHADLSPESQRGAAELSTDMPDSVLLHRLRQGRRRLNALFGRLFEPVVVPPWNRIDDDLRAKLPTHGFSGVSTFGPRQAREPVDGLHQVNAHCDILEWKQGARFRGTRRTLDDLVEHLRDRRAGRVDSREPTGILTHHLDHDEACWAFLEILIARLCDHPAAQWLGGEAIGQ